MHPARTGWWIKVHTHTDKYANALIFLLHNKVSSFHERWNDIATDWQTSLLRETRVWLCVDGQQRWWTRQDADTNQHRPPSAHLRSELICPRFVAINSDRSGIMKTFFFFLNPKCGSQNITQMFASRDRGHMLCRISVLSSTWCW